MMAFALRQDFVASLKRPRKVPCHMELCALIQHQVLSSTLAGNVPVASICEIEIIYAVLPNSDNSHITGVNNRVRAG